MSGGPCPPGPLYDSIPAGHLLNMRDKFLVFSFDMKLQYTPQIKEHMKSFYKLSESAFEKACNDDLFSHL